MTKNWQGQLAGFGISALIVMVNACAPAPSSEGEAGKGTGGRSVGSGGAISGGTGGRSESGGTTGGQVSGSGGVATGEDTSSTVGSGGNRGGSGGVGSGSGGMTSGGGSDRDAGVGIDGASGTGGAAGSGSGVGDGGTGQASAVPRLPLPPGAANVPRPSGTPGSITVINWAGFKGAVSYTFDDSNSSQIEHYAELQALGVPCTFYLWTARPDSSNPIWGTALKDGHEIGNHSKTHVSNGTGEDLDAAQMFLISKFGVAPTTMAAPNGAGVYTTLAKGRFFINRGTKNSIILPNDNTDPFTLPTFYSDEGAAASVFDQQVDSARAAGGWRTFLIHGFSGGTDHAFKPIPFESFAGNVRHTKGLGDMWMGRVDMVGAYWVGQKVFSKATMTMDGAEKTWKWTLPDHFPTGRFLRVTVAGGKLKQGGTELAWDPHGYYEIALDAGSVTLSP
ncbi:MAG: polysaccharide deacetylase family protein [Myxococcales bacterium]